MDPTANRPSQNNLLIQVKRNWRSYQLNTNNVQFQATLSQSYDSNQDLKYQPTIHTMIYGIKIGNIICIILIVTRPILSEYCISCIAKSQNLIR